MIPNDEMDTGIGGDEPAVDPTPAPEPAPEPKPEAAPEPEGEAADPELEQAVGEQLTNILDNAASDEDDATEADAATDDQVEDGGEPEDVPLTSLHPVEVIRRLSDGSMSRPDGQAWLDANAEKIAEHGL